MRLADNDVLAERVASINRRVDSHSERMDRAEQTLAAHDRDINNLCKYQAKQNGSLQRLEDRFDRFYAMLFLALLGLAANLLLTVLR